MSSTWPIGTHAHLLQHRIWEKYTKMAHLRYWVALTKAIFGAAIYWFNKNTPKVLFNFWVQFKYSASFIYKYAVENLSFIISDLDLRMYFQHAYRQSHIPS